MLYEVITRRGLGGVGDAGKGADAHPAQDEETNHQHGNQPQSAGSYQPPHPAFGLLLLRLGVGGFRITSYNVCYTKLLRVAAWNLDKASFEVNNNLGKAYGLKKMFDKSVDHS